MRAIGKEVSPKIFLVKMGLINSRCRKPVKIFRVTNEDVGQVAAGSKKAQQDFRKMRVIEQKSVERSLADHLAREAFKLNQRLFGVGNLAELTQKQRLKLCKKCPAESVGFKSVKNFSGLLRNFKGLGHDPTSRFGVGKRSHLSASYFGAPDEKQTKVGINIKV